MAVQRKICSAQNEPGGTKAKKRYKAANLHFVEGTSDFRLFDDAARACYKSIPIFVRDAARKAAWQVLATEMALLATDDKTE
jgi:uncharacterized protein (DUF1778 family)